ncbi:MAG: PQQ-binding-like beta-propeller repeat protein [Kiritimatiellae bacterium]|nr:PQQ-binding-like beta-propeller repeat protein [Kiritimatiellia bacterium]
MKIKIFTLSAALVLIHGSTLADNSWPMFRGTHGDGTVKGANLPLNWSETENVRWKTAMPNQGWSTPVVQGKRIWLTSATENGEEFFALCVDAKSGKLLIEKRLFQTSTPEPLGNSVNGYASPSPAIEPGRVYLHFGSYGTACLNAESGDLIWQRDDLPCRHYRGPGSSPILYKDLLILTFDGVDQQYLTALNKHNGKSVWTTKREIEWKDLDAQGQPKREGDFRKGFTTPLVIDVKGQPQLISPASNVLFAYDPESGKEIWRTQNSSHTPVVIPVYADGLVMAVTGHGADEMLAIRPDGRGDVTASHVVWRMGGKDVPQTPSPVAVDGLLYMLSDHGVLNCIEIKTGAQIWRETLRASYIASPIHDGERIYLFSVSGKATVIRAGRTFEKLAENNLDAGLMASPAVAGDALILRTKTHLYWIEK